MLTDRLESLEIEIRPLRPGGGTLEFTGALEGGGTTALIIGLAGTGVLSLFTPRPLSVQNRVGAAFDIEDLNKRRSANLSK